MTKPNNNDITEYKIYLMLKNIRRKRNNKND